MTVTAAAPGRLRQKQRTRRLLIDTATDLIAVGRDPTIEEVAAAAGVSRATAYRYFSSIEALVAEVELLRAEEEPIGVLDREAGDDLVERVTVAVTRVNRKLLDNEVALHVMARNVADRWLAGGENRVPRQGERFRWIDAALDGYADDLGPQGVDRLRYALGFLCGMEAVQSARDVAGLSPEKAELVAGWAARALVEAALRHG